MQYRVYTYSNILTFKSLPVEDFLLPCERVQSENGMSNNNMDTQIIVTFELQIFRE